ncbi:MAG: pyridoxamine 5'-phosphate oxidase [Gemmatimonadota bacterium]
MSVLSNIRTILTLGRGVVTGIDELSVTSDPIALFRDWFEDAGKAGLFLPDAVAVATSAPDGTPSVRMMLLKGVDMRGFVLYTNYESRKGRELAANPRASLCFYWGILERQVRVEGSVERIPRAESEAYFRARPRGSQIGAWASEQSRPVEGREALERRFREYEEKFRGGEVPLPAYWGGFRLDPHHIEFWQGRLNRLHDRLRYERTPAGWDVVRLAP